MSCFLARFVGHSIQISFFSISDNVGGRTLPIPIGVSGNTIESCTSACFNAGYLFAGTEYSAECWCGMSIEAGGASTPASECNMLCSGDNTQYCGGPNRLNLYAYTTSSLGNWSSIGCYLYDLPVCWRILCSLPVYRDNVQGRALTGAGYVSTTDMTVENCIAFCDDHDYNYAGLEWYQECYCGNSIVNGGAETTSSDCSFPCTGDASEVCGAGNRLSMYYSGGPPPPAPEIVPSVGPWQSLGCYR